jgi:hypothetical protein
MERDNYYLLLGLDPDRDTTWAAIEPKFQRKVNDWRQLSLNHPDKNKYKQLLTQIAEIEGILKHDESRRRQADEARTKATALKAAALSDLEKQIRVIGAKGYLTPEEMAALVRKGGKIWNRSDVDGIVGRLGITVRAAPAEGPEKRPGLEKTKRDRIRKNLGLLNAARAAQKPALPQLADLYAFLDLPASTSATALHAVADKRYEEIRKLPKTAEVGVQQELVGDCLDLFQNETERALYDEALAEEDLEELHSLAKAAGAAERRISLKVAEELVRQGHSKGISQERVLAMIEKLAREMTWGREFPATPVVAANEQRCGSCPTLAPEAATHCPGCGRPLKVDCPQCGKTNPAIARSCGKCSFAIGDMFLGQRAVDAAKAVMRSDPARARQLLAEAMVYWPRNPQAEALLAELGRAEAKTSQKAKEAADAMTRKELYACQIELDELARLDPNHPSLATLRAGVAKGIAEADRYVGEAMKCLRDDEIDDAIDLLDKALEACADHVGARDAFSRCPPDPPTLFAAKATAAGIILTWKASPSRGRLAYRVVRKPGSQPTRPEDGVTVGRPAVAPFTDDQAEPGIRYFYALFTERRGVHSANPVVARPVVRVAEVAGLKASIGDAKVELRWKKPDRASSVEVWRQPGEPPERGSGDRVNAVFGFEEAHDAGLKNGITYGYRVVALFPGPDGRPSASAGATVMATPQPPPKPVNDLKVQRVGAGYFEASWSPPPAGEVRVYRIKDPRALRVSAGQAVPADELGGLGARIPSAGPARARDHAGNATELHLLPVTVLAESAVAGWLVTANWVDDVEGLTASTAGGLLRASWDYPPGFDFALVVFRTDRHAAGPEDPQARVIRWTREQSKLSGGFSAPIPPVARVYLTVYTSVNRDGRPQYSAGRRVEVAVNDRRRARYKLARQKRYLVVPGGGRELVLTVNAPTSLPELLLVGKPDGYPLAPGDGEVLTRVPPTEATPSGPLRIPFNAPHWFDSRYARLFPARDDDASWLELVRDV